MKTTLFLHIGILFVIIVSITSCAEKDKTPDRINYLPYFLKSIVNITLLFKIFILEHDKAFLYI